MKTLLAASLISLLTACAGTTEKNSTLPADLAGITPNAPLACQYQKILDNGTTPKTTNWYFWRSPERTETRDELTHQGEIWERDPAGKLFYTRVFYNEKVALEYVSGDLAALGSHITWKQLSSLIDTNNLGKELVLLNTENLDGLAVEHYAGKLNGVQTEVDWLPSLALAARIHKIQPEGSSQLKLANCAQQPIFAVKPISEAELNSFRHIDFTDFGDLESDPMVQHLEQLMGEHQHEGH
jgi:hypothetical protein